MFDGIAPQRTTFPFIAKILRTFPRLKNNSINFYFVPFLLCPCFARLKLESEKNSLYFRGTVFQERTYNQLESTL